MASAQIGINREDAETIMNILKKYNSPHENTDGFIDEETDELEIKYLQCSIQITDFDEKSDDRHMA